MKATLILANGSIFSGTSIGGTSDRICEMVFNTSMTGYQLAIAGNGAFFVRDSVLWIEASDKLCYYKLDDPLTLRDAPEGSRIGRLPRGATVDVLEEADGCLRAFEFKWNVKARAALPAAFAKAYPDTPFEVVTPENYFSFLR